MNLYRLILPSPWMVCFWVHPSESNFGNSMLGIFNPSKCVQVPVIQYPWTLQGTWNLFYDRRFGHVCLTGWCERVPTLLRPFASSFSRENGNGHPKSSWMLIFWSLSTTQYDQFQNWLNDTVWHPAPTSWEPMQVRYCILKQLLARVRQKIQQNNCNTKTH